MRRRVETIKDREATEQAILDHAEQMNRLIRLENELRRLGGFRVKRGKDQIEISRVDDRVTLWFLGALAVCASAALWILAGEISGAAVVTFLIGLAFLTIASCIYRRLWRVTLRCEEADLRYIHVPHHEFERWRARDAVWGDFVRIGEVEHEKLPSVARQLVAAVRGRRSRSTGLSAVDSMVAQKLDLRAQRMREGRDA